MTSTSRLSGWKEIASHINRSERAARKWSKRKDDPLPTEYRLGRVEVDVAALDEWLQRQGGRRGEVSL